MQFHAESMKIYEDLSTCIKHAGNMQKAYRKHAENMQESCRDHAESTQKA